MRWTRRKEKDQVAEEEGKEIGIGRRSIVVNGLGVGGSKGKVEAEELKEIEYEERKKRIGINSTYNLQIYVICW